MNKTIKARCTRNLYADNTLLFRRDDVCTFVVDYFVCLSPEWEDVCDKNEIEAWWTMTPTETHLRYATKKKPFTFRVFFDREFSEYSGELCFEDFFEEINMELTSENVERIFKECLAEERTSDEVVPVDGVMNGLVLKKDKLNFYREEIKGMLDKLPDDFREHGGGGWSFLNLCVRKDGEQWTGSHAVMEQLVCLGIGVGRMKYLLPQQMWKVLPGGMPYVAVIDE